MPAVRETRLTPWRPGRRAIDIRDSYADMAVNLGNPMKVSDIIGMMSAAALTADLTLANLMKAAKPGDTK